MKLAEINVEYLDHMGTDLDVVNAARVSFHKESDYEFEGSLKEADFKLIQYLANHNHWSPFSHCSVKFRVKAPIFVARQLAKHMVGFSWNEVSRRYVDSEPEFWFPAEWRMAADNVKQGSSAEVFTGKGKAWCKQHLVAICNEAWLSYSEMIEEGVCPEQARMLLPQNTMTEWIWTGTLYAWARMCQLRLDKHTQKETREVARFIDSEMKRLFPASWAALMYNTKKKDKVCALLS